MIEPKMTAYRTGRREEVMIHWNVCPPEFIPAAIVLAVLLFIVPVIVCRLRP